MVQTKKFEQTFINEYLACNLHEHDVKERGIKEGIKRGRAEGLKEGLSKGKAAGKKEGLKEGKVETAKALLKKGIDINIIAECTNLPIETIQKLSLEK